MGFSKIESQLRGFSGGGFAFSSVTSQPMDLQQILPVAPKGEDAGNWMFYVSLMTTGGSTGDTFVYMTQNGDGVAKDGWYDADGNETYIKGVQFARGEGFFFSSDFDEGSGAGFITSGAVDNTAFASSAVRGFNAKCNPYPVEIDLQDIMPVPPEGEDAGNWMFYISLVTTGASTGDTFVYMTQDSDGVAKDGWYDSDGNETYIEGIKFKPGEGFFFSSDFDKGSACKFKGFSM